jgi:hypothetical protein
VVIALISFYDLFSNNALRKRWGRKRGWREQIIACTEGREPASCDRKKTAYLGLGCGGWGTSVMHSPEILA